MPGRRLGCISGAGIIAALVTLLLTTGFVLVRGGRLFAPGPLNAQTSGAVLGGVRAHAETGGRCEACHTAPWAAESLADRCLACHTIVAAEIDDPRFLHGALQVQRAAGGCRICHPEHRGATASLTVIDPATFPHDATGYALSGHRTQNGGRPFACADCHPRDVAEFDPTTCDACHRQADAAYMQTHAATFGSACLDCHDGIDRYGRRMFDHEQVFPLTGRHAATDCADCHPGARSTADLQAAPQTCVGCHRDDDQHKGQFGADCGACHQTAAWQGATFDHGKSAFPLTGKHLQVACGQCHVEQVYRGTPQTCIACHQQDDQHKGQFGADCSVCHQTAAWQGATFDHGKSAFPLTGKHVQVACGQCHVDQVYRGTPQTCSACHRDPAYHLGVFGTACADCHSAAGWRPARYNRPHTFPQDHGESGVSPCQSCHPDRINAYTCYGCHEHAGPEIAAKHREEGITEFADCMGCHPTGRKEEGGDGGND